MPEPEVIDPRRKLAPLEPRYSPEPQRVEHYHRHEHFDMPRADALTLPPPRNWQEFRARAEGLLALKRGRKLDFEQVWLVAKVVVLVVVAGVLVAGGLHQVIASLTR
jgi:hypothetical protein